jgi:RNA polymerase sigma-32 factor
MKEAQRHPVLSREEERETAIAYRNGDMSARQKLINSNLRYVVKRAHKHSSYINGHSITLSDLVQHGNIGLIKAVDKFDIDMGYRLITYAKWWIDARIKDYILYTYGIVQYGKTVAERLLFFKAGEITVQLKLAKYERRDLMKVRAELAERYRVKLKDILSFESRMSEFEVSMDTECYNSSDSEVNASLHDSVGTPAQQSEVAEQNELRLIINEAMNGDFLDEREIEILHGQFLDKEHYTLAMLGDRYNVSRQRIKQIRDKSLDKIRKYFKKRGYTAQSVGIS